MQGLGNCSQALEPQMKSCRVDEGRELEATSMT